MQIEQIYTGCLAQGAYYITSNGPSGDYRSVTRNKTLLRPIRKGWRYIEIYLWDPFSCWSVSGHVDLSKETGAPIVYNSNATCEFDCVSAKDGQEFAIETSIKVLHTPGHTMESTTFLLIDENGNDHAVFSRDTLFIGDVGRPDLAQKSGTHDTRAIGRNPIPFFTNKNHDFGR